MKFKLAILWARIRIFFSRNRCLCGAARGFTREILSAGVLDDGGKIHSVWGCYADPQHHDGQCHPYCNHQYHWQERSTP